MPRNPSHQSAGAAALPNIFAAPAATPATAPAHSGVFDDRAACVGQALDGIKPIRRDLGPLARRAAWMLAGVAAVSALIGLLAAPDQRSAARDVPRPPTTAPAVTRPRAVPRPHRKRVPRRRYAPRHPTRVRRAPAQPIPPRSQHPAGRLAPTPSRAVPVAPRPLPKRVPHGSPPEFM